MKYAAIFMAALVVLALGLGVYTLANAHLVVVSVTEEVTPAFERQEDFNALTQAVEFARRRCLALARGKDVCLDLWFRAARAEHHLGAVFQTELQHVGGRQGLVAWLSCAHDGHRRTFGVVNDAYHGDAAELRWHMSTDAEHRGRHLFGRELTRHLPVSHVPITLVDVFQRVNQVSALRLVPSRQLAYQQERDRCVLVAHV